MAAGSGGEIDLSQKGVRIGVGTGTAQEKLVNELFPDSEIFYYHHLDGYAALAQGKLDAFVFDKKQIDKLYETIRALSAKYGNTVGFLPAFGICMLDQDSQLIDSMDQATMAADSVKGKFHDRIRIFRPELQDKTKEDLQLLSDFQNALKNNEVYFQVQPQCRMSTGKIVGAESLARWKTSSGVDIPPGIFVPVLEHYGFVTDLDAFIWEAVCKWLRDCIAKGLKPVPISINVSQVDILTIDVTKHLLKLLDQYDLPHNLLKVEITESSIASDIETIKDAVQELRDNGFIVLMDDFGSGYSSLNMLTSLPVDIVKLDAHFLRLDEQDVKGIQILETIINMTRMLAIPIIVEGVEREEHVQFLVDQGCRYVQGYRYYPPMPVAQFESLIRDEQMVDYRGFLFKSNQQFQIREFLDQNIYSDSMLNNILGPVAFYEWDGDKNVDIVRFNQQFYDLVGDTKFHDRIQGIQNYVNQNDLAPFYQTLSQAEKDRLNGGRGVVSVYRSDGSLGQFIIQAYYLENSKNGKLYYASLRETTKINRLQNQMYLLSCYSSVT